MSKQLKTWPCLLLLFPVLIFLYYIFIKSVIPSTTVQFENQVCTTKECAVAAATLHENMNEKIDPCNNFADFVCGNYQLHHNLRDGENSFDSFYTLDQILNNKLKLLLEAPLSPSDKPWHTLAKTYYQKCVDSRANKTAGRAAVLALLDEIVDWPVLNPQWTPFNTSWEEYIAGISQQYSVPIFFVADVRRTKTNASDWTLFLMPFPAGTTLGMIEDLRIFLDTKREFISELKVLNEGLIKNYTNLLWHSAKSGTKTGPLSLMTQEFPNFDLEGYVRRIVKGIHTASPDMTITIMMPEFFKKLHTLITNKRDVANLAGLMLALYLIKEPYIEFENTKFEKEQCVKAMATTFETPLAQMYVKDYFDRDAVTPKVKEMLSLIKQSLREMLNEASWLDDFTRQNAIKKLDAMRDIVGYSDNLFNETYMSEQWNISLPTPTEHFYTLHARIRKKRVASAIAQLNDSPKFDVFSLIVNAFHQPSDNGLALLSPILEHPYYQQNVPDYVNYAGIGAVIGHEIMHGFDNQGREYDKTGNMKNWWTNETSAHYKAKSKCFVDQYNNHSIDGLRSLGENIADNIGVKLAYDAYKKLRSGSIEPVLPGFTKYTVDQMFFILATSKWCDIIKPGQVSNSAHPRSITRALVTMKNSKEYSDAFKCSKTDKMNPEEKCTLW